MLAALKTHVSLREALEIEAIKCAAGDSRHEFQEWYGKYAERAQKTGSASTSGDTKLDSSVVAEELQEAHEAIEAHEQLLADHRASMTQGKGPLTYCTWRRM